MLHRQNELSRIFLSLLRRGRLYFSCIQIHIQIIVAWWLTYRRDEADVLLDARGSANESLVTKNALVSGINSTITCYIFYDAALY